MHSYLLSFLAFLAGAATATLARLACSFLLPLGLHQNLAAEPWFVPLSRIEVGEEIVRGTYVVIGRDQFYRTHEVINRASVSGTPVAVHTRFLLHN